ncbi:hypothetical protein, partial [uncultured Megasphaera sp.]|uniref:hypothetical protein n=1 Tax=uncultured Megasphaera sp. TaxID=165188 RepID=UPI0025E2C2BE
FIYWRSFSSLFSFQRSSVASAATCLFYQTQDALSRTFVKSFEAFFHHLAFVSKYSNRFEPCDIDNFIIEKKSCQEGFDSFFTKFTSLGIGKSFGHAL